MRIESNGRFLSNGIGLDNPLTQQIRFDLLWVVQQEFRLQLAPRIQTDNFHRNRSLLEKRSSDRTELKTVLREKKELFLRNVAEKALTYALGRGLDY